MYLQRVTENIESHQNFRWGGDIKVKKLVYRSKDHNRDQPFSFVFFSFSFFDFSMINTLQHMYKWRCFFWLISFQIELKGKPINTNIIYENLNQTPRHNQSAQKLQKQAPQAKIKHKKINLKKNGNNHLKFKESLYIDIKLIADVDSLLQSGLHHNGHICCPLTSNSFQTF